MYQAVDKALAAAVVVATVAAAAIALRAAADLRETVASILTTSGTGAA